MSKSEYVSLTKKYKDDLLKSLSEFVSINSVYDETTKNAKNPFGVGVSKALQYFENLAKNDGFAVKNYDNMIVEAIVGSGKKNITILAHADVVPAGTGWDNEPFAVTEVKDVLYGRGVADDKGPLLASYYALKALKDNNLLGDYQVRFLVGGNEERGSMGVEHYFNDLKKEQPTLGFSPDSDFPLIFAEKGIINFEVKAKCKLKGLISVSGGVASNSVIEKCVIKMEINNQFIDFILSNYSRSEALIHTADDITTVTFIGKAAHGATPKLGKNAGLMAIEALAKFYKHPSLEKLVTLYKPLDGSGYGCDATSKDMGHNSSNVGLVSYNDGVFNLTVNFRYVNTCKKSALLQKIKKVNHPFNVKVIAEANLLYYDKSSTLVSTLLKSYRDETGDLKSKPLAIGGGTYAKECKNIVAFGMQFPGWESNMHSPGESVKKEDLFKAMAIYARAIIDLGNAIKK